MLSCHAATGGLGHDSTQRASSPQRFLPLHCCKQALGGGVTQVVCIAAGYDTRAYRFARQGVKASAAGPASPDWLMAGCSPQLPRLT